MAHLQSACGSFEAGRCPPEAGGGLCPPSSLPQLGCCSQSVASGPSAWTTASREEQGGRRLPRWVSSDPGLSPENPHHILSQIGSVFGTKQKGKWQARGLRAPSLRGPGDSYLVHAQDPFSAWFIKRPWCVCWAGPRVPMMINRRRASQVAEIWELADGEQRSKVKPVCLH